MAPFNPQIDRRQLLTLFGLVGAGTLLASCSSGEPGGHAFTYDPEATYPAGTMTFYGYGQPEAYTYSIDQFLAAHQDIAADVTVEVVQTEGEDDTRKRIVTAFAGGSTDDLPDFIATGTIGLYEMGSAGALMDVTDTLSPMADKLVTGALEPLTIDGKMYGFPVSVRPQLVYYNQELFDEYGIDPEELDTMEGYLEVGRKLKEASDGEVHLSYADPGSATWRYWGRRGLMPQAGAKIWDDAGEVVIDTDPGTRLALGFFDTLFSEGLLYKTETFQPPMYDALSDGKIATLYMGAFFEEFMRPNLPDMAGKWRVRTAPKFTDVGTRGAPVVGALSLVSKDPSPYAGLFVKWWEDYTFNIAEREKYTAAMIEQDMAYNPPVSKEMQADPFWREPSEYFGGQSFREMEGIGLEDASVNLRVTSDDSEADQLISAELEKYVAGDQSMDEAIANMGTVLRAQIGSTEPVA